MTGIIFDVKEMAVHDGPGIRTTVFLKGCPLRCKWCHNPEGLTGTVQLMYKQAKCKNCGKCRIPCNHETCRPFGRCVRVCPENCLQITGRETEAEILAGELRDTARILGDAFGGITFSGGEPLAQPEFLLELIAALQGGWGTENSDSGENALGETASDIGGCGDHIHLCIETSGYCDTALFRKVIDRMDLVIMDIKLADSEKHRQYTGVGNEQILANFRILRDSGKPYLIRTPMIPGITDTEENLSAIAGIIGDSPWEKLPYNGMAGAKYKMLGMEYEEPVKNR